MLLNFRFFVFMAASAAMSFGQAVGGNGVPGQSIGGGVTPSTQYQIPAYGSGGTTVAGSNIVTDSTGNNLSAPGNISGTIKDKGGQVYNVKAYGATGNARYFLDATASASSANLTSASAAFTSADTGKAITIYAGTKGVWGGTYTSGITATGSSGQTCTITFTNGSGSGGTATVALNNTNNVAANTYMIIVTPGTGFTSAPTAGTASNGTATCSGTVVVATSIVATPLNTTVTYVSSTSVTLATPTTVAVASGQATLGTDDTAAINSAVSACSTAGGGSVYMPTGYYKINSTATKVTASTGCSFSGNGPQTLSTVNGEPDTGWTPSGGTWLECSGSTNCITGNTLRATNFEHIGFMDWTGQALAFGGNNQDGISFSDMSDVQFYGIKTSNEVLNYSDTGLLMYNFEHITSTGMRGINVNDCINLLNQSQYIQGGNSEFYGPYCLTYPKSLANANANEPGINIQDLVPSAGTTLPFDYITMVRPQVNSYSGDATGTLINLQGNTSALVDGIYITGADLEGTYLYAFHGQHLYDSTLGVSLVNQSSGTGVYTFNFDPYSLYDVAESSGQSTTFASTSNTNLIFGQVNTSVAATVLAANGVWSGPGTATTSQLNQYRTNVTTITPSATPAITATNGVQTITLSANATPTITGLAIGERITFEICQPASGGPYTWAWPSALHGGMTIGTVASTCSVQAFQAFTSSTMEAESAGQSGMAP